MKEEKKNLRFQSKNDISTVLDTQRVTHNGLNLLLKFEKFKVKRQFTAHTFHDLFFFLEGVLNF